MDPPGLHEKCGVLVVDDNSFNRKFMACLLASEGFEVVQAQHGGEALKVLQTHMDEIEVAVLDINMPVMNGITTARILRDRFPALAVVAVTSGASASKQEVLAAGCRGYLQKPVRKDDLCQTIQACRLQRGQTPHASLSCLLIGTDVMHVQSMLESVQPDIAICFVTCLKNAMEVLEVRAFELVVCTLDNLSSDFVKEVRGIFRKSLPAMVFVAASQEQSMTFPRDSGLNVLHPPIVASSFLPFIHQASMMPKYVGFCLCNTAGVMVHASSMLHQMLGYMKGVLIGKDVALLFAGFFQRELVEHGIEHSLCVGRRMHSGGLNLYRQLVCKDGSTFSASVSALKLEVGYRFTFEEIGIGIVTLNTDLEWRVVDSHGPTRQIFGISPTELRGETLGDLGIAATSCINGSSLVRMSIPSCPIPCVVSFANSSSGGYQLFISPIAKYVEATVKFRAHDYAILSCNKEFELLIDQPSANLLGRRVTEVVKWGPDLAVVPSTTTFVDLGQGDVQLFRLMAIFWKSSQDSFEASISSISSCNNTPHQVALYRLTKKMTSSAMGDVWKGSHALTGATVVIKHLRREGLHTCLFPPLEVELLRTLDHPRICRLQDVIYALDDVYMVMDYIPGGTLLAYCRDAKGGLSESCCREFMNDIVDGVAYLHRQGIVHRDLKLDNCLVDRDWRVCIVDFGLALQLQGDELVKVGCGTWQYSAPEVLSGKPYSGRAADMWSLGVILFAMATGRLPFTSLNDVVEGQYSWPPRKVVSDRLFDLVVAMLQIDPVLRISIVQVQMHSW